MSVEKKTLSNKTHTHSYTFLQLLIFLKFDNRSNMNMNENVSMLYFPPYIVSCLYICTYIHVHIYRLRCWRLKSIVLTQMTLHITHSVVNEWIQKYHNVCDRIAHYIYNVYMECVLIRSYIYVSIKCWTERGGGMHPHIISEYIYWYIYSRTVYM